MNVFSSMLKVFFLIFGFAIITSCESTDLNEETGINDQEYFQIDKEDVVPPDDRGN